MMVRNSIGRELRRELGLTSNFTVCPALQGYNIHGNPELLVNSQIEASVAGLDWTRLGTFCLRVLFLRLGALHRT